MAKQIKFIGETNNLTIFSNDSIKKIWDQVFETFSIIHVCDNIFSKNNMKSIITQIDGNLFGNTVNGSAKKFAIPSFTMPGAIFSEQLNNIRFYHSDKIFLYGKQAYETLKKLGYDENHLVLSGNPSYDFFKQLSTDKSKNLLNQNFGIDKSKKLIVIAMSRWHENDELWMIDFIKFCNDHNFEIIIKIHPMYLFMDRPKSEAKISMIKDMCKNLSFLIIHDTDLYLLLSASDLVITEYSNVGPEAIFLGKPVFTVNFKKENWEGEEHYHKSGGVIYFEEYLRLLIPSDLLIISYPNESQKSSQSSFYDSSLSKVSNEKYHYES